MAHEVSLSYLRQPARRTLKLQITIRNRVELSTVMMETAASAETSPSLYQITGRHIMEDSYLQSHWCQPRILSDGSHRRKKAKLYLHDFKLFVPCILSTYGIKTNWCHYFNFIYILPVLDMFRAHRPILRRVHTAVHTTIGSVSVLLWPCALYVQSTRPEQYRHWTNGCVNSCVNSPEDGPVGPKHVEIRQYTNKIEIVTSVGFYSIR